MPLGDQLTSGVLGVVNAALPAAILKIEPPPAYSATSPYTLPPPSIAKPVFEPGNEPNWVNVLLPWAISYTLPALTTLVVKYKFPAPSTIALFGASASPA